MNILIVDCLAIGGQERKFSRDFIGGGPKLIAGILNQLKIENLNVKLVRAENIIFKKEHAKESISSYDACLISAMTMDIKSVKKVIRLWREVNKEKMIIIGGPITSDKNLLNKIDADISIFGEGESKICLIIELSISNGEKLNEEYYNKLKNINGIAFRYGGTHIFTEPSLKLKEFPDFQYSPQFLEQIKQYENYKTARVYVECLRGCSNYYRTSFELINNRKCLKTCTICKTGDLRNNLKCPSNIPPGCGFCSTINSFGFPKSRKIEHIISEIEVLLKIGVRRIVLGGPDFLDYKREELIENNILTTPNIPPEPNYEALHGLINHLINLKPIKEKKVQIFIENVKANLCTEKALKILSLIPNSIFSIGCETGSDEFARQLGRPYPPSKTLNAIKMALLNKIRVHVYFIHDLPGEKINYIKDSIEFINKIYKMGVDKITIYKYQEFPGSPFYLLKNKKKLMKQNNKELNRYRKKLVRLIINFNKMRKEEMVNQHHDVFLAELSFFNKSDAIGYIIKGGPKVLVKNASNLLGKERQIIVRKVLSDKFVEGVIVAKNHYLN
jgi:radical SAM superfamily enzyme YgiQ (UPF0313 family)